MMEIKELYSVQKTEDKMSTPQEFPELGRSFERRRITDIMPSLADQIGFEQWRDLADFSGPEETDTPLVETTFDSHIAGTKTEGLLVAPADSELSNGKRAIVIDPGYLAPRSAYLAVARSLARSGNPTAIFSAPVKQSLRRAIHPSNLRDAIRVQSQATLGVSREVLRSHEGNPDERLDYLGHSLGFLVLSEFVDHSPQYVNNAICVGGAGLRKHGFLQMAMRGAAAIPREIIPYCKQDLSDQDRKDFGRQSLPVVTHIGRKLREGYHAATGDSTGPITRGREVGIKFGGIWFSQDTFFPPHELTEDVQGLFDEKLMLHGNHLAPQNQPYETARATRWMLHLLDSKQSQPQATNTPTRRLKIV